MYFQFMKYTRYFTPVKMKLKEYYRLLSNACKNLGDVQEKLRRTLALLEKKEEIWLSGGLNCDK